MQKNECIKNPSHKMSYREKKQVYRLDDKCKQCDRQSSADGCTKKMRFLTLWLIYYILYIPLEIINASGHILIHYS